MVAASLRREASPLRETLIGRILRCKIMNNSVIIESHKIDKPRRSLLSALFIPGGLYPGEGRKGEMFFEMGRSQYHNIT